jgi:hypothetical protein
VTFPTCLKLKEDPETKLGRAEVKPMYKEMFRYFDVENHLSSLNRMYSYDFRNETCIAEGRCKLPKANHDFRASGEGLLFVLVYFPLLLTVVLGVPLIAGAWLLQQVGLFQTGEYTELLVAGPDNAMLDDGDFPVQAQPAPWELNI